MPETLGGYAATITWDQKNRAVSMNGSITFGYDPMNYRIHRSGGSEGSIDYYLEGENLEAEYSNDVLQARYFRGVDPDELVAGYSLFNGKLTPSIYHQDTLNTVLALSAADGSSQAGYYYDAFGMFRSSTGQSADQLRYTGRELDNDYAALLLPCPILRSLDREIYLRGPVGVLWQCKSLRLRWQ